MFGDSPWSRDNVVIMPVIATLNGAGEMNYGMSMEFCGGITLKQQRLHAEDLQRPRCSCRVGLVTLRLCAGQA